MNGDDMARILRVSLDLLAQLRNVIVHGARVGQPVVTPNSSQQLVSRPNNPGMRNQKFKQGKLASGKMHRYTSARDSLSHQVNMHIAE
jgi:hypothetical protein